MNLEDIDRYLATNGLALAQYMYARGAGFGLGVSETVLYRAIGESYYGPCKHKAVRAATMRFAEDFPIARLVVIHKAAVQLRRQAPISRWDLRLELAEMTHLSIADLEKYAKARVRELNATGSNPPPRSLVIGRETDATGRRTAVLKLPEAEMSRFERTLRSMTRNRGNTPEDIAMGNACWALFTRGGKLADGALEPTVIVTTDDLESCGEHELQATDGTRVNAREYLNERLTEYGWALLYDKNAEPVNLWRTQRLANDTQRRIIAVDQVRCAWPGCDRYAMYGTAHHVEAWAEGGQTNQSNLMGLCGPHNAGNGRARNGEMRRAPNGRPVWHPPDNAREWAIEQLSRPSGKTSDPCSRTSP